MRWHIHKWKLSGTLSWLIKISTIFLGAKMFSLFLGNETNSLPDGIMPLILLGMLLILYITHTIISIHSREILSAISNLTVTFTLTAFILHMFASYEKLTTGIFALLMVTAEMVYGLFYYLNDKDKPLLISRSTALWMIAAGLFLFGLLTLSVR